MKILKNGVVWAAVGLASTSAWGQIDLVKLKSQSVSNGWGPLEINRSNGEQGSTDGRTLTLNGATYSTGLGVHAGSTVNFALPPNCSKFSFSAGIDDEVGNNGSVVFKVVADSATLASSPKLTGSSSTWSSSVNLTGQKVLTLIADGTSDGTSYDHADWVNLKLTCPGSAMVNKAGLPTTSVVANSSLSIQYNFDNAIPYTKSMRAFVHFVNASGNMVFQDDHMPTTATNVWAGSLTYNRAITIPATAASGTYSVMLGLYDTTTGARQKLQAGSGVTADGQSRYKIGEVIVDNRQPASLPTPPPVPVSSVPPAPTSTGTTITYSAPIVITKGGTYTGNWESLDAFVPAVTVKTYDPVIIENCNIRHRGIGISAPWSRSNLTVRYCNGQGLNSMVVNRSTGRFIASEGFESLVAYRNTFSQSGGIYLNSWSSGSGVIKIYENFAKNMDGRQSDGNGGFSTGKDWAQFVQLNSVKNNPNVEIAWNKVYNEPRKSFIEDTVNLYNTTGTSSSKIKVHDNLFIGAYAPNPEASYSGGGIMMGDGCGNSNTYSAAYQNTIIETSNYGIAMANGNYNDITNNVVLATGRLSDGTFLDAENDAGLYARNYCSDPNHNPATNTSRGNKVGWGTPSLSNMNGRWDTGLGGVDPANVLTYRVDPLNRAIPQSMLDQAIADHEARAVAAGKKFGK